MEKKINLPADQQEAKVRKWIIGISVAIPIAVAVLLFMPAKVTSLGGWVYFLPHLNAVINTAASIALLCGLVFIKQKKIHLARGDDDHCLRFGCYFLGFLCYLPRCCRKYLFWRRGRYTVLVLFFVDHPYSLCGHSFISHPLRLLLWIYQPAGKA